MELLINTTNLSSGGGLQVAISFILSCKKDCTNKYYIALSTEIYNQLNINSFGPNFSFFLVKTKPNPFTISGRISIAQLSRIERDTKPDCVFSVFGPTYWKPKAPHLMGFALGHFIYKDSPYFQIISMREKLKWKILGSLKMHYVKRDAATFHIETEDAKQKFLEVINSKNKHVHCIPNTYSPVYNSFTPKEHDVLLKKGPDEFRFACISSYYRHKNLEILNQIIPELISNGHNIKFVLTIRNNIYNKIFSQEAKKQIINVGGIEVKECPQIYHECDAVFVPSLLEIFTANYPEAMKMRRPIITTDLSFARDICRTAALYYAPNDYKDATRKIIQLTNDNELRNELILNGEERLKDFPSPEERAEKIISICKNIKNEII